MAAVSMGVGEGFLDDPVRGEADRRRHGSGCAGGVPFDLEADVGEVGDQVFQVVEGGEGVCRRGRFVGLADHAEDAAQFVEHACGSTPDVGESFLRTGRVVS